MGAPFEAAAAGQTAAFFKVKAIEQSLVEGPPGGGAEIEVPVHLLLVRLGFGREPTAAWTVPKPPGMGVERLELAELAAAGQINREGEIGQAAPLRAGLEDAAGAAERLGQREALGDVLGAGLFAIHVLAGIGGQAGGRGVPVRAGGDEHGLDVAAGQQVAQIAVHGAVLVAVFRDRPSS